MLHFFAQKKSKSILSDIDQYWPYVTSRMTFEDSTIKDLTGYPLVVNGAVLSTAQKKFGSKSCLVGGGKTLQLDAGLANFKSLDFAIEMWVYYPSTTTSPITLFSRRGLSSGYCPYSLVVNGSVSNIQLLLSGSNGSWTSSGAFTSIFPGSNKWVHVALVRKSGVISLFLNGVKDPTTYSLPTFTDFSEVLTIGNEPNGAGEFFIDDVRITSGAARYTSNFTPDVLPVQGLIDADYDPYWDNVALLMHMNGTDGGSTLVDEKARVFVNTAVKTNASKAVLGSAAAEFTGSQSSTLKFADSIDWRLNSDFTFETFIGLKSFLNNSGSFSAAIAGYTAAGRGWNITLGGSSATVATSVVLEIFNNSGSYDYVSAPLPNIIGSSPVHLAITRRNNIYRIFINGIGVSSKVVATESSYGNGEEFYIGRTNWAGYTRFLDGYLDELRFTKGIARYSANFPVQTKEHPKIKSL